MGKSRRTAASAFFGALLLFAAGCGSNPVLNRARVQSHDRGVTTRPMGNIYRGGFEILPPNISTSQGVADIDGVAAVGSQIVQPDTFTFRSGQTALHTLATDGNYAYVHIDFLTTPTVTYYARAYFNFFGLPPLNAQVMAWQDQTNPLGNPTVAAVLTPAGKFQLWNVVTNTQIGSDSAATVANTTLGPWYRLELSFNHPSGSADFTNVELRVDGVTVASGTATGASPSLGGSNGLLLGYINATSGGIGTRECYIDDVAVNDSVGTSQNTWPGEGKIVVLRPTSDNARGGWTAGAGATASLFAALNSTPTGKAVASETNTSQIKSVLNSATDNYDANMTSYTAAGIGSTDTITLVVAACNHAEGTTTGTKLGALKIVSNPAQSTEDGFTYGSDGTAAGAFPTNWVTTQGSTQYSPTVVKGTAPVVRVGKRSSTNNEVDVDMLALTVEYVAGAAVTAAPHRAALLGVGH